MISSLRGTVLAAVGTTVVIEVGGVGLSLHVTPQFALSLRVGAEASVRTALIVREDDLSLFGFAEADELAAFDLLRGVTGVGPKSAMGVLAAMSPVEIAQAVSLEDDAAFRKVSGIGPKTAKLIVLSLTGKLDAMATTRTIARARPSTVSDSVTIALVGLGWPERVALQATEDALAQANETEREAVPALLRLALANLGPQLAGSST
ncbi:Holliday junction ATP-dependent DNA helicase RuvA [Salinibacterium xinjiangense]|uniref:Holliday junction branch migration complex subunit RuvA n=1 Tax=Salinibacterium xinjiangense TaxID=386302 RepID=A0A2C9A2P2_9MICO|nr:Holliday junction branch migration protein RuvA [Salinibacterium xinjiangense]GGK85610.1 Holliday junction ATP-dependent DNA helicase RuvA [Salinibacterium xinjiangense]SOE73503.1 Holliday junction DNA helicase subunit RuvA [Salinibacterium xinjiangense]